MLTRVLSVLFLLAGTVALADCPPPCPNPPPVPANESIAILTPVAGDTTKSPVTVGGLYDPATTKKEITVVVREWASGDLVVIGTGTKNPETSAWATSFTLPAGTYSFTAILGPLGASDKVGNVQVK